MDYRLIRRLISEKLQERTTYGVALVVGTLINIYGQLLVPWLRGSEDPFAAMALEFSDHPLLAWLSVALGYLFPLCVGVYSSVATRYKHRRTESVADFPDRKPDPVFRAARDGRLVEVGATTRALFEQHQVDFAQQILGDEVWSRILSGGEAGSGEIVYFEAEGTSYIVSHARTANEEINIYLTRFPANQG